MILAISRDQKKELQMFVKVFKIYGVDNIQAEIQDWLDTNPGIQILTISQSASGPVMESDKYLYVITVIYSN
jgi:hypothetical protein